MSEVQYSITEKDPTLQELKRRHAARTTELQNLSVPFKKVTAYLDSWVQRNFKEQGALVGGWKPFANGGRLTSKGIDTSAKLLMDTGRLRASFLPFANNKNAGIGSELPYSKTHQEGLDDIPQRRILPNDAEVREKIIGILGNRIKEVYND